jgi:hypothetical protein
MKFKSIVLSVLSIGLLTGSALAQTTVVKTKLDTARMTPVQVSSTLGADGRPVIVVSGRLPSVPLSLATMQAKAPKANVATTPIFLSTNAAATRTLVSSPARVGSTTTATTGNGVDTLVVSAAGAATTTLSANPLGASIERQVFVGDLARDTTSLGLAPGTAATTAATTTGATAVGPNGFPIFLGTAVPQSGTNPIGPDGFPQPLTNGPQAGIQPIGPDGFPIPTTPAFAATGLTRAGTPRDATVPATTPVGRGATAAMIAAPNAATAVMSGPASLGTAASAPH